MTDGEKKDKKTVEELHKVGADTVVRQQKTLGEAVVSATSVGEIRKGIVTGSSVAQARKEIEQSKKASQPEEKKPS